MPDIQRPSSSPSARTEAEKLMSHNDQPTSPLPYPARSTSTEAPNGDVVLCLGPTNTGKTHRAIERMLEHPTGMIGLPLRLLAREVYDKVSERVGPAAVALITGEERRIPRSCRYFICTVEAMPISRRVDFVCVDEIQLAAHPERGHVFTDRLLHLRGRRETWFLGSEAMLSIARHLLPRAELRRSPRFSTLKFEGALRMGTLKPRAAVVAFSMKRVYELAERIKARRGGVAVVLGALSPRARNAQVAMYESGEVDYLVATDAIGMGLNLDLERVAFSELRKFDGHSVRDLSLGELAQIAGRAGRHQRDGFFGTFPPLGPLDPRTASALENHRIPQLSSIHYRNPHLDFTSLGSLFASLHQKPSFDFLDPVPLATDAAALADLRQKPEILDRATSPERLKLLFEVCQVPDYQKALISDHTRLLAKLYCALVEEGELGESYFAPRLRRLREHQNDLDSILPRLADCRTLSYVAGRSEWVTDSAGFREQTELLEDELSDALHQALTERFVVKRRRPPTYLAGRGASAGRISHRVVLSELHARLTSSSTAPAESLAQSLALAPAESLSLDEGGRITFRGQLVARVTHGSRLGAPGVRLLLPEGTSETAQIRARLRSFLGEVVRKYRILELLPEPERAVLSPAGRGLCYQLTEHLGSVLVEQCRQQLRSLRPQDRVLLTRAGVFFGRQTVYLPALLTGPSLVERAALAGVHFREAVPFSPRETLAATAPAHLSGHHALALGFFPGKTDWVRIDLLERILELSPSQAADELPLAPSELERLREHLSPRRKSRRRRSRKQSGRQRSAPHRDSGKGSPAAR